MKNSKIELLKLLEKLNIEIEVEDIMNCLIDIRDREIQDELDDIAVKEASKGEYIDFLYKYSNKIDVKKLEAVIYIKLAYIAQNKRRVVAEGDILDDKMVSEIMQIEDDIKKEDTVLYYLSPDEEDKPMIIQYKNGDFSRKKKEEENKEKMMKINEEIGIENILACLSLTDVEDFICSDPWLGELITTAVVLKSSMEKTGLPYDSKEHDFSILEIKDYLYNFADNMMQWSPKMNTEKLLLMSGYRYTEWLENYANDEKLADRDTIESFQYRLEYIYDKVKDKKLRIVGEGDDIVKKSRKQIKFEVQDLKNTLKRFTEDGKYINNEKMEEIKQSILNGEEMLKNIAKEGYFSLIPFSKQDEEKIMKSSEENFLWLIDKKNMDEKSIIGMLNNLQYSFDFLDNLLASKKIGSMTIKFLYEQSKISEDTIQKLDEKYKLDSLLEVDETIKDSSNYEYIIKLLKEQIVSIDEVREHINDDTIIKEFDEPSRRDVYKLLRLYETGIITDEAINLIVPEYKQEKELVDTFVNDNILSYELLNKLDIDVDIENVEKIIKEEQGKKFNNSVKLENEEEQKVDEEKLYKAKSVIAYAIEHEKLSNERLDEIYKKGIITEDDLFEFASKRYFSENSIIKLYTSLLISEDILNDLVSLGILSEEKSKEAIRALNTREIIKTTKDDLGLMINDKFAVDMIIPDYKMASDKNSLGGFINDGHIVNKKREKVIDPFARQALIKTYGAHLIERVKKDKEDEKSPFDNYEFYIITDSPETINPDSIVIAERYYVDRLSDEKKLATGNATYMFRFKDLARVGKKSKLEINSIMKNGACKSVKKINHIINTSKQRPNGWATNLTNSVNEWKENKTFKSEDKKSTDVMIESIDGIDDKGEWARLSDVYSDTGESAYYEDNR